MKKIYFLIFIVIFILAVESGPSSRFYADERVVRIATRYAVILSFNESDEAVKFLAKNFDRIYGTVIGYLNLKPKNEKLMIQVVDFHVLQGMHPRQKNYPEGNITIACALYQPSSNSLFFTPLYMNDYYVTHELLHYFMDEHQEEMVHELSKTIIRRSITNELTK